MDILVHACCGPCACWPVKSLSEKGHQFTLFWYNPNIHPFDEYQLRLKSFKDFHIKTGAKAIFDESHDFTDWLEKTRQGWSTVQKKSRCFICYSLRLEKTAEQAVKLGFKSFTTTLLYSKYQYHDDIRVLGVDTATKHGLIFYYEDFRTGWQDGIKLSKEAGLYRQKHCGCAFSIEEAQKSFSEKHGR